MTDQEQQLPSCPTESEAADGDGRTDEETTMPVTSSLEVIKRKLSVAGLTDEVHSLSPVVAVSVGDSLSSSPLAVRGHRRSRSLGEVIFQGSGGGLSVAAATAVKPVAARSLKLSSANVAEQQTSNQGLEQIKRKLLQEIKTKLKEQIESIEAKECHTTSGIPQQQGTKDESGGGEKEQESNQPQATKEQSETETVTKPAAVEELKEEAVQNSGKVNGGNSAEKLDENQEPKVTTPITPQPPNSAGAGTDDHNKRFSVCSLSGVELRKRYSPVYERTRKIVRQSSTSINRWSSSQPQVVPQSPQQRTANGCAPSSPPVSAVDTPGTVAALSPVASKGNLEGVKEEEANPGETVSDAKSNDGSVPPTNGVQQNVEVNTSFTRIGQYSAHPSVYVIEQENKLNNTLTGSGLDESRSDKMDRSTNTLKRGGSFRGLRKNIKKTFSTQIPALTLEKAEKTPDSNVPAIVTCCVETLRRKGFLRTEGLYRSSPSQLEVRKVIKHARKGQYDYVKSVDDPVILAGTLKSFFFNLKHHIISEEVMEKNFPKRCLLGNTSEREYVDRLKGLVSDLDTTHYESLEYIIKHLQEVASLSKFNLMTPANLGVVWAPCLFTNCDKSLDGADLLSFMGEQTRLLELLITNADLLFDRYTIDEIMIAIEDGYTLRDGEPTLNLRPDFDVAGDGRDLERRKLLRNLSLTLDNLCEASITTMPCNNENGNGVRHYDLQNSYTVPAIGTMGMMNPAHHSDGTVGQHKLLKMKRSRSRAVCVVS